MQPHASYPELVSEAPNPKETPRCLGSRRKEITIVFPPRKFTGSVYWRATYTYKGYTSTMCAPLLHISYIFTEIQGPLQLLPRNQRQSAFRLTLWTSYQLYGIKSPFSPETYKKGSPALSTEPELSPELPACCLPACQWY